MTIFTKYSREEIQGKQMRGRAFWFCFPFSTISVDLLCLWITAIYVQCSVFSVQGRRWQACYLLSVICY
ncbi:MAG: hypothetical protein ACLFT8_02205, partial [Desulfovermiculus sp.]